MLSSLLRNFLRISLMLIAVMLSLAAAWTVLKVAELILQRGQSAAASESRRGAYEGTATALAAGIHDAGPRDDSQIVLMQQVFTSATPMPNRPSQEIVIATPRAPQPAALPKLILPIDPREGLVLAGTAVPERAAVIPRDYDLVNVILLGGDDELTADRFIRTDTMIIASLNRETGTVSMVNLPRDLFVYIPSGKMGRLNTAYGIGENIGWQPDGGFGLLRQTVFYNFGINVHYYARVNFSGFKSIIDRLGGVDIAVDCAYRDLYPVSRTADGVADGSEYRYRRLDAGYYTFDGFDALWYARTRRYTDDLDRGRRQQQLLRGMWRKARSSGLITTVPRIWGELNEIVDTNLPFETVLSLLPLLVDLELDRIQNFTFLRNFHTLNWRTPSGDAVLLPAPEAVADLMRDFYQPPSSNQQALAGPSIAVYNSSGHADWDRVASERLRWDGYNAVAMGAGPNGEVIVSSRLIDQAASSKGSLVYGITKALNMTMKQVETQADPGRSEDYKVILGADYEPCTYGVLPIDES